MRTDGTARPTCYPRGYTLVEMLMSIGALSVLMLAMMSAVMLASRGLTAATPTTVVTGNEALAQMTADLEVATGFTERTATAVTMTVPDRNGDGAPESIRYTWSGSSAGLLTRQVNGGTVVTVATGVKGFSLAYLTRTVSAPPPVESPEQLLICHDQTTGGTLQDSNLTGSNWAAAYIKPTLGVNAVSWKVTRVRLCLKKAGLLPANITVAIRTSTGTLQPAATVLESKTISSSTLDASYAWVEFTFSSVANITPGSGLCVVISSNSLLLPCGAVEFRADGMSMTSGTHYMFTTNSGSTWTTQNDTQDVLIYVYGTVTTQG